MSIKAKNASIRAGKPATPKGKRGPAKGQGGAPSTGRTARLSVWVRPETKAAILAMGQPGPVIDELVAARQPE